MAQYENAEGVSLFRASLHETPELDILSRTCNGDEGPPPLKEYDEDGHEMKPDPVAAAATAIAPSGLRDDGLGDELDVSESQLNAVRATVSIRVQTQPKRTLDSSTIILRSNALREELAGCRRRR